MFRTLSYIVIHYHTLSHIVIHYHTLSHIVIHYHAFSHLLTPSHGHDSYLSYLIDNYLIGIWQLYLIAVIAVKAMVSMVSVSGSCAKDSAAGGSTGVGPGVGLKRYKDTLDSLDHLISRSWNTCAEWAGEFRHGEEIVQSKDSERNQLLSAWTLVAGPFWIRFCSC